MRSLQGFVLSVAVLLAASACDRAAAVPTLDGTAGAGDGYASLSVQNTNTEFGDANLDDLIASGGGSEIDQVFGKIENGRLYMVVAGNLENTFNKLEIFVDSVAGGVNKIDGDIFTPGNNNVPFGMDPFCCGGFPADGGNDDNEGALQRMDGLTFDASFEADYVMAFMHGGESVGDPNNSLGFWAMSAHYADLTQGTAGDVVAAGIQLAPTGLPNVLRGPLGGDFNEDGDVTGDDFLTWQRNNGLFDPNNPASKADGDGNGDGLVNAADLAIWESDYGNDPTLSDFSYVPNNGSGPSTEVLIGPALPGLSHGELVDRSYALGAGGCTDDSGAGCVAAELEFVLNVDPNQGAGNPRNHRSFENTVGLQLAFNNSNTAGVQQGALADPNDSSNWTATGGDPNDVITGVEFSIALSELGDPNSLSDIKIVAFINGNGHHYSANQYGGEGVLQNNLGGDGSGGFTGDLAGVDLSTIAGDQFVTLTVPAPLGAASAVPEPTALVLLGIGVACGVLNRKRRL